MNGLGVPQDVLPLQSSFLFSLVLKIRQVNELGITPYGRRRIVDLQGGSFEGPKLSGIVRMSGADSAVVRPDGVFVPDVSLILESEAGALVKMYYTGRWSADPGHLERLLLREGDLTEGNSRLRVCGFFETADEELEYLNRIVAVGVGVATPAGITYQFHEIL